MASALYVANFPIVLNVATAAIPASLLTTVTYTSPVYPMYQGNAYLGAMTCGGQATVSLTSSQAVTVTINRYLDPLGLVLVDTVSASLTGATAGYAATTAVVPSLYFNFTIYNATGSTANITYPGVALIPNP